MRQGWDFTNGSIASRNITWNADNMPVTISHSTKGTTTFTYDGDGVRAKKVAGGTTTYYIGNDYEIKNGTHIKSIFAGNLRVAEIEGSTATIFHKDHLGSSIVMTDSAGTKVEGTEYLPFGGMRAHTGTEVSDYKFTDQELDSESNLYNYDARLYDPVIGRFISPDSIVPNWTNPQSLNRYSYTLNNPLVYTDPTGHFEELVYKANEITDNWANYASMRSNNCFRNWDLMGGSVFGFEAGFYRGVNLLIPANRDELVLAMMTAEAGPALSKMATYLSTWLKSFSKTAKIVDNIDLQSLADNAINELDEFAYRNRSITINEHASGHLSATGSQKPNPAVRKFLEERGVTDVPVHGNGTRLPGNTGHHAEQRGIAHGDNIGDPVVRQASSSGANHGGKACADCDAEQVSRRIDNITGVQ